MIESNVAYDSALANWLKENGGVAEAAGEAVQAAALRGKFSCRIQYVDSTVEGLIQYLHESGYRSELETNGMLRILWGVK